MSVDLKQKVLTIIPEREIIGDWVTITQEKIDQFAAAGGEFDWLHNEPERCVKESPFDGKTIAQGNLLLSIHTALAESLALNNKDVKFGLNYGYDRVRFIQSVTVNSEVRAKLLLKEVKQKSDKTCIIVCDVTTEINGLDTPALVAGWLFYIEFI